MVFQLIGWFLMIFGIGAAAGGAALFSWLPLVGSYGVDMSIVVGLSISFAGWLLILLIGIVSVTYLPLCSIENWKTKHWIAGDGIHSLHSTNHQRGALVYVLSLAN